MAEETLEEELDRVDEALEAGETDEELKVLDFVEETDEEVEDELVMAEEYNAVEDIEVEDRREVDEVEGTMEVDKLIVEATEETS